MVLALIIWILTVVISYCFVGKLWWFPDPINAHGEAYYAHFVRVLWAVGLIFVASQGALGWVIFKYRDDGKRGSDSHGNNKLEVLWTSATAILFVGLVLSSTGIWAGVHFEKAPDNAVPIEVLGKQFAWSFRYPGPDGKFGRTDIKLINDAGGNPFGIDEKDPAGKDDIVSSSIRVPVRTPIRLILRSRDVIHNFFVRELRLKQDLVPGMEIPYHFQADKEGEYEVPCSELCGLGHHQMRSTLIVLSAQAYDEWLKAELKKLQGQ